MVRRVYLIARVCSFAKKSAFDRRKHSRARGPGGVKNSRTKTPAVGLKAVKVRRTRARERRRWLFRHSSRRVRRTNGFTFRSPSRKYTPISPLRPTASGPFALSKLLIFLGHAAYNGGLAVGRSFVAGTLSAPPPLPKRLEDPTGFEQQVGKTDIRGKSDSFFSLSAFFSFPPLMKRSRPRAPDVN